MYVSEGSLFPACEQAFINCAGNGENSTCVYTCDEFFPRPTLPELIFGMTKPTAVLTCSYRSHLRNIKSNCQFVM